jgi:hypothetical protein
VLPCIRSNRFALFLLSVLEFQQSRFRVSQMSFCLLSGPLRARCQGINCNDLFRTAFEVILIRYIWQINFVTTIYWQRRRSLCFHCKKSRAKAAFSYSYFAFVIAIPDFSLPVLGTVPSFQYFVKQSFSLRTRLVIRTSGSFAFSLFLTPHAQ